MATTLGRIAGLAARGASTTAIRGLMWEATAACAVVAAASKVASAGQYCWRYSKARARFARAADGTKHAYGMIVRSPGREFFTVIVEMGAETLELETAVEGGRFEIRSVRPVLPVTIKIAQGWVEETRLLRDDLPVVFEHDHGTVPSDCERPETQKIYLGMAQDSSAPDSKRADAMEIPFFGANGVPGTVVLDRQGTVSQLVILPYDAVSQVDTLLGCAADTARKMPPPSSGVVIDLPAWWTMPVR